MKNLEKQLFTDEQISENLKSIKKLIDSIDEQTNRIMEIETNLDFPLNNDFEGEINSNVFTLSETISTLFDLIYSYYKKIEANNKIASGGDFERELTLFNNYEPLIKSHADFPEISQKIENERNYCFNSYNKIFDPEKDRDEKRRILSTFWKELLYFKWKEPDFFKEKPLFRYFISNRSYLLKD